MCLFPKLVLNPKYKPNKKNNYQPPICTDERIKYVPIGCGVCIECTKKKAREWRTRLMEELKENKNCTFVTLTFSNEKLLKLCEELEIEESNVIASKAVRRFCERYRKKNKKTIKHWLITELGHNGTERIHLHGIIWDLTNEEIEKYWQYGQIWTGEYVNEKTINYIMKYVTKLDTDHKNYKPNIFSSKGIGKRYVNKEYSKKNKYKPNGQTNENYRLPNGQKIELPIYYRNKIYTEKERELLWLEKLDKQERYVLGEKIDISTEEGEKLFEEMQKNAQEYNKKLGFGDDSKQWKKEVYNVTNQQLNKLTKLKIINKINKKIKEEYKKNKI